MAARARTINKLRGSNREVHESVYLPQLVAYSSREAHSSIEKAAKMAFVQLRVLEPDNHDSLRGDTLKQAIEKDLAKGLTPFFVVATVGTTGSCAFDNLTEIGQVRMKHFSHPKVCTLTIFTSHNYRFANNTHLSGFTLMEPMLATHSFSQKCVNTKKVWNMPTRSIQIPTNFY